MEKWDTSKVLDCGMGSPHTLGLLRNLDGVISIGDIFIPYLLKGHNYDYIFYHGYFGRNANFYKAKTTFSHMVEDIFRKKLNSDKAVWSFSQINLSTSYQG